MSAEPIISVSSLTKAYRIWSDPTQRLLSPGYAELGRWLPGGAGAALRRKAAAGYRDFYALRDVSFEVQRGEAVGIIGRNGSGKSTLLQMIAGTLQPTAGTVAVRGRVAALLELGSGFNPDFTGRENVYLNAAILGLSRPEIEARFAAIAEFADIGEFIEQPVKTYSSGMMVRLAFAVQTAVEPDILIVDEALSVGDFFFQQKCFARIRELRTRGTTLLFVSHDMASVRDLCDRALYLRGGRTALCGPSQSAIALYYREGESPAAPAAAVAPTPPLAGRADTEALLAHALWRNPAPPADASAPAEIVAVEILDAAGQVSLKHRMGDTVVLRGYFRGQAGGAVHVAVELKNRHGQLVSSLGTRIGGLAPAALQAGELWCFEARIELALEAGLYTFQVCLGQPHPQPNLGRRFAETPWLGPLTIDWDYTTEAAPFLGMFHLPATVSLRRQPVP